ncbi:hypothetical protein FT663_00589 [Candidozyma haemuli var. vulneris]|uniref:Sugar phosphate transporter domain-containing protein n=1 Tax=Candidozyma haemuli TaxID=45357 RepID=A0A2V1B0S2_9ASCO|nr:hypothetical protein CXQ85_004061 [[Candida] haemuloni]KAF3993315.1 hypothetical protein FT662_00695 [[Candida] haemuloni var. vulneris]KAF3995371.1 hypothetical protein FT663_00589 [[Candida] haemuloni var. vulneris]PVH23768.1 hypothetical protein CXQ85_004061 [[Candida] haemuloni]
MLSVNHSVEDIHRYPYPQRTSQINPNMSTTNIFQLNHPKAVRSPLGSYQQITPPASNSSTPVAERREGFFTLSANPSTTSLEIPKTKATGWASWLPEVDVKVVTLCALWYGFSIVSNNSTKAILSRFSYPVTLTQFQFLLNACLCIGLFAVLSVAPSWAAHFPQASIPNLHALDRSVVKFLTPNAFIISTTLPMGIFQFLGHITSHKATSMIPVSLVHTIKSLSPISTVLIYRLLLRTKFRTVTYVTLLPLIFGIMLTCYKPKNLNTAPGYFSGLGYAFVSMLIFVSQNIFAKQRLTVKSSDETTSLPSYKAGGEKKLDKLTILLFCSVIGFLFTMPIYLVSEYRNEVFSLGQLSLPLVSLVVLNGVSHFLQSLLAFQLLGTISPINYSIANIMKRIVVIMFAFVWEGSFSFVGYQSYGVLLTIAGLYCYDKWGMTHKQ